MRSNAHIQLYRGMGQNELRRLEQGDDANGHSTDSDTSTFTATTSAANALLSHSLRGSSRMIRPSVTANYGSTDTNSIGEDGDVVENVTIRGGEEPGAEQITTEQQSSSGGRDQIVGDGNSQHVQSVDQRNDHIAMLTRRLRCVFTVITAPIIPLGTVTALALLWFLYSAFALEWDVTCSRPLHGYGVASLFLVSYMSCHNQVRARWFQYVRERDGPHRPVQVRRCDQIYHTVALLYVYAGITLVQTCRQAAEMDLMIQRDQQQQQPDAATTSGVNSTSSSWNLNNTTFNMTLAPSADDLWSNQTGSNASNLDLLMLGGSADVSADSCAATCPRTMSALSMYVTSLELFALSLILPLLFLPCIYLWFLRQAMADQESLALLQERLQEEEEAFLIRNGGTVSGATAQDVLENLEPVMLVQRSKHNQAGTGTSLTNTNPNSTTCVVEDVADDHGRNSDDHEASETIVLPAEIDLNDPIAWDKAKDAKGAKECCICMSRFNVHQIGGDDQRRHVRDHDIETGMLQPQSSATQGAANRQASEWSEHDLDDDNAEDCDRSASSKHSQNSSSSSNSHQVEQVVVRTKACGHLFHERCITIWVTGRRPLDPENSSASERMIWRRRKARRTTCPLCRHDLRPSSTSPSSVDPMASANTATTTTSATTTTNSTETRQGPSHSTMQLPNSPSTSSSSDSSSPSSSSSNASTSSGSSSEFLTALLGRQE